MKKGLIALDIDGTITTEKYTVPLRVVRYLHALFDKGWQIVILTGRSYIFAKPIIDSFDFPLLVALQNGSLLLQHPDEALIYRRYMNQSVLPLLDKSIGELEVAQTIYSGYENKDLCYWKRGAFVDRYKDYMEELAKRQNQHERIVDNFYLNELKEFPLIKCIGSFDNMTLLTQRLSKEKKFSSTLVKDPFDDRFYMLLVTEVGISKGFAINYLKQNYHYDGPVIAAGNDDNDYDMLEAADIKIVMVDAPKYLKEKADYIAPPASEDGVISVLEQIFWKIERNG